MKVSLVRWSIFLLIGLPVQGLMYLLYPIGCLLWRIFIFEKVETQLIPPHGPEAPVPGTRNGGLFLDNRDNHGAFTFYGFITWAGLERLIDKDGNFLRRLNEDWSEDKREVSGDVIGAWAFAQTLIEYKNSSAIKRAIDNHIKYLGTRSDDGWVSNKANNVGLNYCPDGWGNLGQPAAGPQFYTTSCLLALGYDLGFKYKVYFWSHWLLLGGWYWAFCPIIYTKENPLNYVKDITMKALWVHLQVFGPKWWITKPMEFITDISLYRNDLFKAMLGEEPVSSFPECTSPFFSQRANCAATPDSSSNSPYLKAALYKIAKISKYKK